VYLLTKCGRQQVPTGLSFAGGTDRLAVGMKADRVEWIIHFPSPNPYFCSDAERILYEC
jgi:hypothetical protein